MGLIRKVDLGEGTSFRYKKSVEEILGFLVIRWIFRQEEKNASRNDRVTEANISLRFLEKNQRPRFIFLYH